LQAADVQLAWDPSPSPEVTGYHLYWGPASRSYDQQQDVGFDTSATVTNLVAGTTYYFAVTAYESAGLESDFSNEVVYEPPLAIGNAAPTLAPIGDQTINEDGSTGPIALLVGDADTDVSALSLTATSSNTGLVPAGAMVFGGSGANRTLTITPAANRSGTATITVRVSDGALSASRSFGLTVTAVNDAPTLAAVANRTVSEDTSTGAIALTVGDVDTDVNALSLTATSSNTGLVPAGAMVFGGSGANRTLTITPAANQSGTATITVRVSDGALSASRSFGLTVTAVNDAPTLAAISDRAVAVNTSTGPIALTVGDVDNDVNGLSLTATSSNTGLVPAGAMVFGGSGANRTLTITPAANQSGTATITVRVSDGALSASRSFVLTVTAVNTAPTLAAIANRTINEDTSTGPITLTVGDVDNDVNGLSLTATSSNTGLVPAGAMVFGGSGANRTLTITPAANQSGTATITVRVSDGKLTASRSFSLTVNPVNDRPTLAAIASRTINEDTSTGAIALTVGDVDNDVNGLSLTATSSDTTLVPAGAMVFGGSGANRTLTIQPARDQNGTTTITVRVSDGALTASRSFKLTVNPVNDRPTLAVLSDQTIPMNTSTGPLPLTLRDVDNDVAALTVTATSSDTTLVPAAAMVFGGSGANRTLSITPSRGQKGTATITVRVSDGALTASRSFVLNVSPGPPVSWQGVNLGEPLLAGGVTYANQAFQIQAAGEDMGFYVDQGYFLFQTLSGDGEITARVAALEPTHPNAKAGVMIRDSLNASARMVFIHHMPNGVLRHYRSAPGISAVASYVGPPNPDPHNWFRLTREGNTFTTYHSSDGVNWKRAASPVTIALPAELYIGLAVTSRDPTLLTTATFDSVTVIP
jgi:predicted hotdog family 3-hydroxylacyl-ACP dehydratase